MAKYADYVNTVEVELIDQEIDDAASRAEQRKTQDTIPDRFKDKSREEIARAWEEANATLSRQGQEVGALRKQIQELSEKLEKKAEQPEQVKPVTIDEIYEDADQTLRRVAREESSSRIAELERRLEQSERAARILTARQQFEQAHPNYREILGDSAFIDWIKASPVRTQLAMLADQGDFDAANELFSTYGEIKQAKRPQARTTEARRVGLERSGGGAPAPEKTFSRVELNEKRIAAQRGDIQAARWLSANDADIRAAYQEGRLTT